MMKSYEIHVDGTNKNPMLFEFQDPMDTEIQKYHYILFNKDFRYPHSRHFVWVNGFMDWWKSPERLVHDSYIVTYVVWGNVCEESAS